MPVNETHPSQFSQDILIDSKLSEYGEVVYLRYKTLKPYLKLWESPEGDTSI